MQFNLRECFSAPRVNAFLGALAWLVVAFAGIWALSGQVWRFVLPQAGPNVGLVTDPARAAATVAGRHPFGVAAQGSTPVAAAAGSYRLLGVIAASAGQPSAALLQLQGGAVMVVGEGAEVEPGVRLSSIGARAVRLVQKNMEREISLPERGSASR
jgi:hypothetical protein